jgi:hypothetical protein
MKPVLAFSLSLIVALGLVPCELVLAEAGVEMHRAQAGERDGDGWYLAKSTNGEFSVLLPLPFNDFTVPAEGKSEVLRAEVVGTKSSEGMKFSATRMYYTKDDLAEKYFGNYKDGNAFPGATRNVVKVKDYDAVEVELSDTRSGSLQRAVLVNESLILLIIEWPKEHESIARQLANKFFESLDIGD